MESEQRHGLTKEEAAWLAGTMWCAMVPSPWCCHSSLITSSQHWGRRNSEFAKQMSCHLEGRPPPPMVSCCAELKNDYYEFTDFEDDDELRDGNVTLSGRHA